MTAKPYLSSSVLNPTSLLDRRIAAADAIYSDFDFGIYEVQDQSGWEFEDEGLELSRPLYCTSKDALLEEDDTVDTPTITIKFVVTFCPDTRTIDRSYAIDTSGNII